MLDLVGTQNKNLAAAGNDVPSVFAVDFMPAHSKRKVKLEQMKEDSWKKQSLMQEKTKGA